jgi:hypothetical protein
MKLTDLSKRQWMAAIFLLGLGMRLALAWVSYSPRYVYTGEAEWIGKSIALHGAFSGAYAVPTGPTAHCGPFYTTLVSLIYFLLGTGTAADIGRIGLLILVNATACAMLPAVAVALRLPLWAGVGAGLAAAVIPMHRTAEMFHAWDEPYAALGLMVAIALLPRWTPLRDQPLGRVAAYGVFWGLLLLISPAMLLVLVGLPLSGLLVYGRKARPEIKRWLLVGAVAGLVLIPWTVRNRLQLGGWIFVRSNLGIELDISNNDRSGATSSENSAAGLYRDTHPSVNVPEAERVRDMGELAYNRQRLQRALNWIKTHPARFAQLTAARVRIFWFGWWGDRNTAWIFTLTTMLAAAGAWFLWHSDDREVLRIFGTVWLCYPLTYYLVQHLPRYRIPIWWTLLLAAAYGAGRVVAAVRLWWTPRLTTATSNPAVGSFSRSAEEQSADNGIYRSGRICNLDCDSTA